VKNIPTIQQSASQPRKLAALKQAHQAWNSEANPLARLARRLATTLSLETQLGILTEELAETIPFDALNYRHRIARQDFVFATGMGGQHRCEYRLTLEGINCGTLVVHRRRRFQEEELQAIETIISVAICHLRNACQFASIEQAALTDPLTDIPNKRAMNEALHRSSQLADRHGEPYSLILCDLDHFKAINDNHGHIVGDHLLQVAAEAIERSLRVSDSVYRFGGEEFAILLPHTDAQAASDVADRIRQAIAGIRIDGGGNAALSVTASCGVAMHMNGETSEQWLARADEAMYRAKKQGRNCTRVFAAISPH
jgi:diguanylate cyclase (GGDEF)-like protein